MNPQEIFLIIAVTTFLGCLLMPKIPELFKKIKKLLSKIDWKNINIIRISLSFFIFIYFVIGFFDVCDHNFKLFFNDVLKFNSSSGIFWMIVMIVVLSNWKPIESIFRDIARTKAESIFKDIHGEEVQALLEENPAFVAAVSNKINEINSQNVLSANKMNDINT